MTIKLLCHMKIKMTLGAPFVPFMMKILLIYYGNAKKTQNFIRELTNWLQGFNIQCSHSEEYFIFGLQKERMACKTLNFIFLYAKYFIYCAPCNKQTLLLSIFKKKQNYHLCIKCIWKKHYQIINSSISNKNGSHINHLLTAYNLLDNKTV